MNVFLAIDFFRFLTDALGRRWFCSEMRVAKAFFGTLETISWGRCLAFGVWCFLACASGRHLLCSEILFAKAFSGTRKGVFSLFCSEPFVAGAPFGTGKGVWGQEPKTRTESVCSEPPVTQAFLGTESSVWGNGLGLAQLVLFQTVCCEKYEG